MVAEDELEDELEDVVLLVVGEEAEEEAQEGVPDEEQAGAHKEEREAPPVIPAEFTYFNI